MTAPQAVNDIHYEPDVPFGLVEKTVFWTRPILALRLIADMYERFRLDVYGIWTAEFLVLMRDCQYVLVE